MVAEELKIVIKADSKRAQKNLRGIEQQTQKTTKSMASMRKLLVRGLGFAAAAVSVGALTKAMRASVEAYGQQVTAERTLAGAIEATGENAEELLPRYKALASEIQSVTTVGDESTLALMQQAQSMGISSDKMEEATKGAIGLSKAFGIGTQQAIKGVANAMQGNFQTLQRYIPALRTTEDEGEKMAIVQKAMADGFKVAESEANSAYGALQQLGNSVGDLQEELGEAVAEGVEPFVGVMTDFVNRMINARKETKNLESVMDALNDGTVSETQSVENLESALSRAREELTAMTAMEQMGGRAEELRNTVSALKEEIEAQKKLEEKQRQRQKVLQQYGDTSKEYKQFQQELAALEEKANTKNIEALGKLEELRRAQMEPIERQKAEIQDQIDSWATLRNELREAGKEYGFIQQYINALAEQKGKLKEAEEESIEAQKRSLATTIVIGKQYFENQKAATEWMESTRAKFDEMAMSQKEKILEQAELYYQAGVDEVEIQEWVTERKKELRAQEAQAAMNTVNQVYGAFSGMTSAIGELQRNQHQREINNIDAEIEAAEKAGEDTTELERKKQEKIQQFKRQQWAKEKAGKLLQATISGAQAVVEALPNLALAAVVGGLSAVQIGTIAATQNPYYRGGVIDEPVIGVGTRSGESYSFGERGPEKVTPMTGQSEGGGAGGDVYLDGEKVGKWLNRRMRSKRQLIPREAIV